MNRNIPLCLMLIISVLATALPARSSAAGAAEGGDTAHDLRAPVVTPRTAPGSEKVVAVDQVRQATLDLHELAEEPPAGLVVLEEDLVELAGVEVDTLAVRAPVDVHSFERFFLQ